MTPGGRISVDVRLFAVLREHRGTGRLSLDLPIGATVQDAVDAVWTDAGVAAPPGLDAVAVALDREYASRQAVLRGGEELALIPPVSGGAASGPDAGVGGGAASGPDAGVGGGASPTSRAGADGEKVHVRVTSDRLDQGALHDRVARPGAGAIVTFSGTPRDVVELRYEAHEDMAVRRMTAILAEAAETHGASAAAAEHRTGPVPALEPSIVVAVSAPHRGAAFAAAREALDRIKAEAPVWKQEVEGGEGRWVAGTPAPGAPLAAAGTGVLPHLAADGAATMVDVGAKAQTERRAVAAALVSMSPRTAALVRDGDAPKGDVVSVARLAGIAAAKRTPDLVPLAHPLALTRVGVEVEVHAALGEVRITAEARAVGRTGVELEAMVAAQVAAINVYDMVKGVERGVRVGPVVLREKSGGRHAFTGPAPWEDDHAAAPADPPAPEGPAAPAAAADHDHAGGATHGGHDPHGPSPAATMGGPTRSSAAPDHRPLAVPVRVGLLVVSSSRTGGDAGAAALDRLAADLGFEVAWAGHCADAHDAIADELRRLADEEGCDVVLTAGGTGFTVDDVTPEAARSVADRDAPGIAEALRLSAREHTANWPLSRGVAVIRGRTLVVTLPGSPRAADEAREVLAPVLEHAVGLLRR